MIVARCADGIRVFREVDSIGYISALTVFARMKKMILLCRFGNAQNKMDNPIQMEIIYFVFSFSNARIRVHMSAARQEKKLLATMILLICRRVNP